MQNAKRKMQYPICKMKNVEQKMQNVRYRVIFNFPPSLPHAWLNTFIQPCMRRGGGQLKSDPLKNPKYKVKNKKQKAAHRIGILYCEISKEKDPWESKMQNAKSRKGVLCCASGKERDPRDNGHYYQINIEPSQYGIILQNRTEAFPKRKKSRNSFENVK